MSTISKATLKKMVMAIAATRIEEYDCDLCLEKLEMFVELDLLDENPEKSYPLVKNHLDSCVGCSEEYGALLDALRGIEASAA
jgi:hypothetical protein